MVIVRPATAADLGAVQAIYASCIAEASWLPRRARQDSSFADVSVGELVHVAVSGAGTVIGLVSVYVADSFIHHLYVHPDARGAAVGQWLLASLTACMPMPWRLKCVRGNRDALRFYQRCGWVETGAGESEHGPYVVLSLGQRPELPLESTRLGRPLGARPRP